MVKKLPVEAAPEVPLAPAFDPAVFAAKPIEKLALLACVTLVLVWVEVPVEPPGVVCEVAAACPVFCPAPAVVPTVNPAIAVAPLEALVELLAP